MEDDDFIYLPDLLGSIDFEKEHVATYDPHAIILAEPRVKPGGATTSAIGL